MTKSGSRRGQAAMEYLMTYGWAILIVLAIMGILIYLVRPQKVESCSIAQPFQCVPEHYRINAQGNLTIDILNIGSTRFLVKSTSCGSQTYTYSTPLSVSPGNSSSIYFNCAGHSQLNPQATAGKDTFESQVSISYYPADAPTFTKTAPIDVVVKYQ